MKNRKIHIITLGCPKNAVDSEVMAAKLKEDGFFITPKLKEADVVVINTCAFIQAAKEEAIDEIFRIIDWKESQKTRFIHIVVTGCLPQRYGRELEKEIPEVALFLGINEIPKIAEHIEGILAESASPRKSIISEPYFLMDATHRRILTTPFYSSYIKIAEGCSNKCSYCVIPAIRGNLRSRAIDDILKEAEALVCSGVKEIILIAQDTTSYGVDLVGKPLLGDLLRELSDVKNLQWIRLLYTHPARVTKEIFEIIAQKDNICSYIDIPVQHIDDDILRAMNRRTTGLQIKETIITAREIISDVAIRTSIIVGFPGETRARFYKLLPFIKDMRFEHLGAFIYSKEEGTMAAAFPSRISKKEKEMRRNLIMEEQAIISYQINQSLVGSYQEVIIEGKSDIADFPFIGRSRRQAPDIDGVTYVKGNGLEVGDLIHCKIISADEYDFFAEKIEK